ncbi:MAG: acetyl-CoA carboxylase biotin carboxyl carrier protein [Thermoanaerobaculia bacterium]
MLTFEEIKELIELVATRKLEGLEVENEGFRLKIDGQQTAPAPAPGPAPAAAAPPAPAVPESAPPAPAEAPAGEEPEESEIPEGAHVLTSPIVGTFYRASAPDADPYVEEGDRVKKGQVLCIVEAMKLMNEIESDVDGRVVRILPENAQPVEFGEPLFAIRPA